MPSAMSRPSEPVETVSTSIECMFLPSRMIEPLPKLRSICESAASRAFDLSMDDPSTIRSAALIGRAPYGRDFVDRQRTPATSPQGVWQGRRQQCTRYVLGSQYVLIGWGVLAPFHIPW